MTTHTGQLIECWVDAWQRTILFWDVLRERGNRYLEHERSGKPPVLAFDYEMVLDARSLERPANYALVRITPPVQGDGSRPVALITFAGVELDKLYEAAFRLYGLYWNSRSLTVQVVLH